MSTPTSQGLKGSGYNQLNFGNLPPELMQQISGLLSSQAGGGDEQSWGQLEAPAMRQHQQLLGGLASRFSGMGSGSRRSSGFQNAASGATTDFAERLRGQRMGLQQNAISQLMNLYSTALVPEKKPFWQELLGSMAGGVGQGLGTAGSIYGGQKLGIF